MMINNIHLYDTPATSNPSDSAASSAGSSNNLDPSDFMSLLVAEIQNQDPTNPMDPTTFMTQLVNLNELEQVTQINQVVQEYAPLSTAASSTPATN